MKTKRLFLMICSIVILNTGSALQAEEVKTFPTHFGTIDAVRINEGQIVISDNLYPIVSYAKVHPSAKYSVYVPESLKPSMTVGFRLESITGIPDPTIVEVWALDSFPNGIIRRLH